MINLTLPRKVVLFFLLSVIGTLTFAQTGTLSGTLLSEKKEPLVGATVKVANTKLGAATDIDGKFIIPDVPTGSQTLNISYVGYTAQNIKVDVKAGDNAVPNVTLKTDALLLNDVVVVGYGTQVKRDVSSSVAAIKAEDLKDAPIYNFSSGIQGKASGVQITTDNGVAGASTTIRIRGTKSLASSVDPLYVIDGVPIVAADISDAVNHSGYNTSPLSDINPSDIESIEILKDAAATAIYGARGANGVLIVTTKQGKEGVTKVDISSQAGITQPAHKISLLNGTQYADLYQEAYNNDGGHGAVTLPNGIKRDSIANTNWIDKMFQTGYFTENNISASGGTAKTNFFVGMGLRDEQSFLVGNKFQRGSVRLNLQNTVNKYFSMGINTGLTRTTNKYVRTGGSGGLGTAQSTALPIYPVYNADGSYFLGSSNPLAQVNLEQDNNTTWRNITNAYFNVNFTPELTFRNEFGIDLIDQQETFYKPVALTGDSAIGEDRRIHYLTWNYSSTLTYKKQFKENHYFEAVAGFNPTRTTEQFSYIQGKGFPVDSYTEPQGASRIVTATAGTGRDYSFVSFFARANYKLFNKYLFQASFRSDGSSRFAPSNRFGYFPAASFGWVISDENFMKRQKVLTYLKLRASAGATGNAELSDDFAWQSSYSGGQNYGGQPGIGPSGIAVPTLTWETTIKTDVGIDFSLFNDRLSGLFDFYQENTSNLLIQSSPLSPSSGFSSVTRNQGKLYNRGVELQLTSYNLSPSSKLQWKTTLNFGLNRNKVTDLGGVAEVSGTNYGDNRAIVGQAVGVWYLAKYAGVDPQSGAPLIYDFSGNKVVADANTTVKYRQAVGRPYPLFYGGLSNNFSYKGFEVEIFLVYSVGNSVYDDGGKRSIGNLGFGWNEDIRTLNRWQKPGDITDVPKLSLITNYDLNTTHYLYDASFLRLRTLTFAYKLPEKVVKKMHMRSFRVYVSGQNLATATAYKGWDPETNREKSGAITQGVTYLATPQARTFSLGFNLGF